MDKRTWTTYARTGYMYDVANDQRSAGGVHLHQVRRTRSGWQKRILQSNGKFSAPGPVEKLTVEEGEALWARAEASL